jgi:hypothetical protein
LKDLHSYATLIRCLLVKEASILKSIERRHEDNTIELAELSRDLCEETLIIVTCLGSR